MSFIVQRNMILALKFFDMNVRTMCSKHRKPYPKSSRPVLKVALVDSEGNKYIHYDKGEKDSESNKKEEKTKENKE